MLNNHSSRFDPFVLFSSNLTAPTVDEVLTAQGIPYAKGIGSWKGQEEPIWIVPEFLTTFQAITIQFLTAGQELVLALHPQEPHSAGRRPAELVYIDNSGRDNVPLGLMTAVPEAKAREHDSWTYVSGLYWIAEPQTIEQQEAIDELTTAAPRPGETQPNWIA